MRIQHLGNISTAALLFGTVLMLAACDGSDGTTGNDGATGKDGKDGASGLDGLSGKDGASGAAGLKGKDGAPGVDGVIGKDGSNGTNGAAGGKGLSSLLLADAEPAGLHCSAGGVRISTGLDSNADGVLGSVEITSTHYMCNSTAHQKTRELQFVYTSDPHFGITRAAFQGATTVSAVTVNTELVSQLNLLPAVTLPNDNGVFAGLPVGAIDYVIETGDLANRAETGLLKAAVSWGQFASVYLDQVKVLDHNQKPAPMLLAPGNHDVSNAIGHAKIAAASVDATSMVEIFNRMMSPAVPRTTATYNYAADRVHYSVDVAGVHLVFVNMWPDSGERAWLDTNLSSVDASTPVLLFTHDEPSVEAKHFTAPVGVVDSKFENLLVDAYADGASSTGVTTLEQRAFALFLASHKNIVAYFHGNSNFNEFYDFQGPDANISLPVFRVDSPMKGAVSAADETKLSFQVISIDPEAKRLTARECLWNSDATRAGEPLVWGATRTISLAPRAN